MDAVADLADYSPSSGRVRPPTVVMAISNAAGSNVAGYAISQRKRKRVAEIFGWMKAYGGMRRTMARGLAPVRVHAHIVAAAHNLLRMSRLGPATG